jgi:hypothetical protein
MNSQGSFIAFSLSLLLTLSCCGSGRSQTQLQGSNSNDNRNIFFNNYHNTVFLENQKPGENTWYLSKANVGHTIEGFASATSVNRGETIKLYVNTTQPTYTMDIYRMGWYGGAGARRMMSTITRSGTVQSLPKPDPVTGLIECTWSDPYVLSIPNTPDHTNWASGIYVVKLSAGGQQSYITFVVRDDQRNSDILMQQSVTTYQAYNVWGGLSLYGNTLCTAGTPNCMPRAHKVSFDRPYTLWAGAGDLFAGRWEYDMLRFLEREGYDVAYSTDLDTHENGFRLWNHKAFITVGHDEYWSWQMRDNVQAARDLGINLGFFSSNTGYWQVRFEADSMGHADRTMVCYKDARLDPVSTDPVNQYLTTVRFRDPPVYRPEDTLLGVMYEIAGYIQGDLVVDDASSWVWAGTGVKSGDHLIGLLGYEADREFGDQPLGTVRLTHSPYLTTTSTGTQTLYADSTIYTATSGATVFAAGSMDWNWGLDAYAWSHSPVVVNPIVQQATRNIFKRFGVTPVTTR